MIFACGEWRGSFLRRGDGSGKCEFRRASGGVRGVLQSGVEELLEFFEIDHSEGRLAGLGWARYYGNA